MISIIMALVTGVQIVGQVIVARLFGAHIELDAFVSAVTIPTVITAVITGTLNDAILPLIKKKQREGESKGDIYFIKIILILSFVILISSICIDFFSIPLINMLFGSRGNSFVFFTNKLMKWMIYTMIFSLVGSLSSSYLYSKNKFILPSFAYLLGSVINLVIIIVLSPYLGIWSMPVAFIAATIVQLIITFPYKIRYYFISALPLLISQDSIREIIFLLKAWIPLIASSFAMRFDNIIIRSFASRLPEGYIVYTNLASKLFIGLIGIATIGLQTVFFPHLLDLVHRNDLRYSRKQVQKIKLYGLMLTCCIILIVTFISPFFMRIVLIGGKFSRTNVEVLISLFPYLIIPAVGWGIAQLFFQPIIAIGKQHILTIINIVAVVFSWFIASLLYVRFDGLIAISGGLTVLSFTGIIGAEIIWQQYLNHNLAQSKQ